MGAYHSKSPQKRLFLRIFLEAVNLNIDLKLVELNE